MSAAEAEFELAEKRKVGIPLNEGQGMRAFG